LRKLIAQEGKSTHRNSVLFSHLHVHKTFLDNYAALIGKREKTEDQRAFSWQIVKFYISPL